MEHAALVRCASFAILALGLATGCQSARPTSRTATPEVAASSAQAARLSDDLQKLGEHISRGEAETVAQTALSCAARLAHRYRVIHPAWLHNTCVNFGYRRRGLCYHWAEDLERSLSTLPLDRLQIRWVVARQGTHREHNAILVYARDHPPSAGIVLDAWRHGGRLCWAAFSNDKYPWTLPD